MNNEIARAALALTEHMDAKKSGEKSGDTNELPLASVTTLDAAVNVAADGDDVIGDLDDTGVNEELTVNMHEAEGTLDILADDETAEMPVTKDKAS